MTMWPLRRILTHGVVPSLCAGALVWSGLDALTSVRAVAPDVQRLDQRTQDRRRDTDRLQAEITQLRKHKRSVRGQESNAKVIAAPKSCPTTGSPDGLAVVGMTCARAEQLVEANLNAAMADMAFAGDQPASRKAGFRCFSAPLPKTKADVNGFIDHCLKSPTERYAVLHEYTD